MRPLAERKSIHLEARAVSGIVEADRGRLRQILYNLLSNAIKYTPDGGRVWLETATRDGEIGITVADTGVGIAPADQALVISFIDALVTTTRLKRPTAQIS